MKIDKKTATVGGLILLGLIVTFVVSVYALPRMFVTLTKAAPATKVSISNSYLIGKKILAKADGKEACVVNVFALDSNSKGVSEKSVTLSGEGAKISPETVMTDSDGKATFNVTAVKEGQVEVGATIQGAELSRKLKLTFRN